MFSAWVTMTVRAGEEVTFLAGVAEQAETALRDEPGCVYFDVVALGDSSYGLYEVYTDAEAFHIQHRHTAHYARWQAVVERTVVAGSRVIVSGERQPFSPGGAV